MNTSVNSGARKIYLRLISVLFRLSTTVFELSQILLSQGALPVSPLLVMHLLQLTTVLSRLKIAFWEEKASLFLPDLLSKSSITQSMSLSYNGAFHSLQIWWWARGNLTSVKSVGVCLPIHHLVASAVLGHSRRWRPCDVFLRRQKISFS